MHHVTHRGKHANIRSSGRPIAASNVCDEPSATSCLRTLPLPALPRSTLKADGFPLRHPLPFECNRFLKAGYINQAFACDTREEGQMLTFYFDLEGQGLVQEDLVGLDFECLETAYVATCDTITVQAADMIGERRNPFDYTYVIRDERGAAVMEVPFTDLLSGRSVRSIPKSDVEPRAAQKCTDAQTMLETSSAVRNRARQARAKAEQARLRSHVAVAKAQARLSELHWTRMQRLHVD